MDLLLQHIHDIKASVIAISGSKSETNRLLLLQALYPSLILENASTSDDSKAMIAAFEQYDSQPSTANPLTIDIHHAGTAMRFLTAYFAIQENYEVLLTGSSRMKERPIKILVDALQQLGANISYEEKEGFPPLRIKGKRLFKSKVSLQANVSSQYISALLLIAPKLKNGLEITLESEITSAPYIKMTLGLLNKAGIETLFTGNKITVHRKSFMGNQQLAIESDWSSASYFYSIIALSKIGTEITLSGFKKNSLQGDASVVEIYKNFGVETVFEKDSIVLKKVAKTTISDLQLDLNDTPDLAQTVAVTCFGLGMGCELTGLHTLKIKETDRRTALQNELTKLGANMQVLNDSLILKPSNTINSGIKIATYQDHRMAMAFAPLALKVPIVIEQAEVVSKSYPAFWNDLKKIGFAVVEA